MAEPDLRAILVAFAEKGWNLYESRFSEGNEYSFLGPVDNLKMGQNYFPLPAVADPNDWEAALRVYAYVENNQEGLAFVDERGVEHPFRRVRLDGDNIVLDDFVGVPLQGTVDAIVDGLKPYDPAKIEKLRESDKEVAKVVKEMERKDGRS